MIKICSVVVGDNLNMFLKNLKEVQNISNFIELRVDYIKNISLKDLEIIKNHTHKEAIFTCRSIKEGGKFKNNKQELADIIYKANELKFDYIDIEKSMLNNIAFSKKNSKIIGSYHNFNKTPTYKQLHKIYNNILEYEYVDIVKIATNVIQDNDNIELIKLLINKKSDIIVIGMGEKGKIIRIITPLLGGYLTFASHKNNITASGQYTIKELLKIYGNINK